MLRNYKGAKNPNAKLTEWAVKEIVFRKRRTRIKNCQLAKYFQVSESTISRILSGEQWEHLQHD